MKQIKDDEDDNVLSFVVFSVFFVVLFLACSACWILTLNEHNINKNNAIKEFEIEQIEFQSISDNEKTNIEIEQYCIASFSAIESLKEYDKKEYIIQYHNLENIYGEYFGYCDKLEDCYSDEQIQIMWKCIETEAYDCPFDAKVNVANVILNRVEHDLFPPDPIEIITAENQFVYGRNNITDDTKLALQYAFEIEDTTNGCIGFRSDKNPPIWNGWEYCFTDGKHYFYKMKGE